MASRFCSVTAIVTGVLSLVLQINLPLATAQEKTAQNRKAEADRLLDVCRNNFQPRKIQHALQVCEQAAAEYKAIRDLNGEWKALVNLGNAYLNLENYVKAIESEQQALSIAKEINDKLGESKALANLGLAYDYQGKYDKAIEYYQQWLAIARETKDRIGESKVLGNLGLVYANLSNYEIAIEYYQQWLVIVRETKDRITEGKALDNLGIVYDYLGKYDKAIEYELQSLAIARETQNRLGESKALGNLGITYQDIGNSDKSIAYQQQSLAIALEIRDRQSVGAALGNLGNIYLALRNYTKAIEYHQQNLAISQKLKDRQGESVALGNLGNVYLALGNYAKAIENYHQQLAIVLELKDKQGQGAALGNLGLAYQDLGNYAKAIEYQQQHLVISREIKDRQGESYALNNLGLIMALENQTELAILFYKESVSIRESIRSDLHGLKKEEQQSFVRTVSHTYRTLADLLIKQGRIIEALQVLDLLKIQELEDYLKNVKGNERTARGIGLLEPEKAISAQLSAIDYEKIPSLNRDLASRIQQLPKSEINKVPDYLQKLPQGAVIIYPLILEDRIELIVFSANTLPTKHTVPIQSLELSELVKNFRADLQDNNSIDVKDSGKKLYDILIKPIEADLRQAKTKTILYSPDGILRYIPLAALYDGKQWLIEQYRINNLISYSLFDSDSKLQTNIHILAGAFGGKGGELRGGMGGLPSTIPEVNNIAATFSKTTELIGRDFTADSTKSRVVGQTIVHLATHALFQSGSPLDSYVLFGDDSKVTLSAISDWNLKNIDLVVLSACQTGLGASANGAEILGFGYQVQKAGAKASIASLWTVSDGGTQLLMQAFYENLRKGNPSLSTSLRDAQLSMIHRPIKNGEPNFEHPYFWSAFVLIGNGL